MVYRWIRINYRGFTLIELLVVIGILLSLMTIVIIAINPFEQLSRTADIATKATAQDFVKANAVYFTEEKEAPWDRNPSCMNELNSGGALSGMSNCISELLRGGEIQSSYVQKRELGEIFMNKCGDSAIVCYNPRSKEEYAEARFNKFGVSEPGCPGQNPSVNCYWCKPVIHSESCNAYTTPTPTIVISPTSAPPGPQNPWGHAAVFAGKVAGLNPPSYSPIPEYVRASYDDSLDLQNPNVTVEAWIKPNMPAGAGYHFRIVDSTYRLTMDARPNGGNIAYQYYFDVQSSSNGCGQTVVYSGTASNNPWYEGNYKNVTPQEFASWKHVAGVLQNGDLSIYENGVRLNTYDINMNVCNDGRSLHIGAGLFGKNLPYYDYFQGQIDEVRVSRVARYSNNFPPPSAPFASDVNTIVLYHFDENVSDSSSNQLHGTITGAVNFVESSIP